MSYFLRNRAELVQLAKASVTKAENTSQPAVARPARVGIARFIKYNPYHDPDTGRFTFADAAHAIEYGGFERQPNLSAADRRTENRAIATFIKNKEALADEFQKRYGTKMANADLARALFHETEGADIAKHVGYNGRNSAAVQEAASSLNKLVWRRALENNPEPEAILYAGGSGSGKSTAVKQLIPDIEKHAAAVLDGNLSSLKSATDRLEEISKAGKQAKIVYVYREPTDAWVHGVVKRMRDNEKEGGRIVPMSVFLQNTKGSLDVVRTLAKDGYNVTAIDNSRGKGNAKIMSVEELSKIALPNADELRKKLTALTKEMVHDGKGGITKEQYDALIK